MSVSDICRLVSLEYLPPMIMAFVVGLVFGGGTLNLLRGIIGLLSVAFLVLGFNSFNAIYDVNIDMINKPTRPLPSGKLSCRQVLNLTIVFFAVSLILAFEINYTFLLIDVIGVSLAVFYSHPIIYLKKYLFISTMTGTVMGAVIYPLEGWAVNAVSPIPWYIILLLLFVGLGTGILKDFEDIEGDARHRIKTIPVTLDHSKAARFASCIILISLLVLAFLIFENVLAPKYIIVGVFIVLAAVNSYLLSKDPRKHVSRRAFIYAMGLLTLVCLSLIILRLF